MKHLNTVIIDIHEKQYAIVKGRVPCTLAEHEGKIITFISNMPLRTLESYLKSATAQEYLRQILQFDDNGWEARTLLGYDLWNPY